MRLTIGWLVWLTTENIDRRLEMVKASAESLSHLSSKEYEVIAVNNNGLHLQQLDLVQPSFLREMTTDKNYIDLSAIYYPYLRALEAGHPYFCYLYDDFVIYKDPFEDCMKFMDENADVSCMRLPAYETDNLFYNSRITPKSVNPDAVSHLDGAGDSIRRTPFERHGPFRHGSNDFYRSNWRPNSRPMLWRTKSFERFASLDDCQHPVMQPNEARMFKIADELAVKGDYVSAYLEGGMCKTFPVTTSERTRASTTHWNEYTVDTRELLESYRKGSSNA